jgi:hypothetical protein
MEGRSRFAVATCGAASVAQARTGEAIEVTGPPFPESMFAIKEWIDVARTYVRELLEALALVVVLGLLPVGAHYVFSLDKPGDSREWVVPELYLFVMVTCGQAAAEAFRDSARLSRTVVFISSALGVLCSAGAYGILYVAPSSPDARLIEAWLQANVVRAMVCASLGYTGYHAIRLFREIRSTVAKTVRAHRKES